MSAVQGPFKVVMLGAAGVGKSSILEQYVNRTFTVDHRTTLGQDFVHAAHALVDEAQPNGPSAAPVPRDLTVNLQLWDTAGQERYRSMASTYFKGAKAAVIVFDATDVDATVKAAQRWAKDLHEATADAASGPVPVVFVANKVDLLADMPAKHESAPPSSASAAAPTASSPPTANHNEEADPVTRVVLAARGLLDSNPLTRDAPILACCAKYGTGINDVFEHVARSLLCEPVSTDDPSRNSGGETAPGSLDLAAPRSNPPDSRRRRCAC
uniref:Uncharacterized protein n=1 Tax=Neobodo designis TaxID=312471 RepID=A0A7S1Q4R0_NEODS|mmetsp:Transcript_30084/g.92810  ORF Transcript_30084/g.92810 Transcript_30084/m.92810 type:complete len:269 (+) Transcript_30084:92-898(+)